MPKILVVFVLAGALASAAQTASQQPAADYATLYNRGSDLVRQGRFHEAVVIFRQALDVNPEHLPSHQALAVCYAITGNFVLSWQEIRVLRPAGIQMPEEFVRHLSHEISEADAVKSLDRIGADLAAASIASSEHPNDAAAMASLAEAMQKNGDYGQARTVAERALQLDPSLASAHYLLGELQTEPQSFDAAIPHWKAYLEKVARTEENRKQVSRAYELLSNIYMRSGADAEALTTMEAGVKAAPDNATIWNNAAWIYATSTNTSLRNKEKALSYARKAVELSGGKQASFLDTFAEAAYLNGRIDEAIEAETKALALRPGDDFLQDQLKKFQKAKAEAKPPQQ